MSTVIGVSEEDRNGVDVNRKVKQVKQDLKIRLVEICRKDKSFTFF